MLKIYEAENNIDAQLVMDALQAEDLEVIIKGQLLAGAAGDLPAAGLVTLWLVHDDFEQKAKDIIAEYESNQNHCGPAQDCSKCGEIVEGNFDSCWNCGAMLPMVSKKF